MPQSQLITFYRTSLSGNGKVRKKVKVRNRYNQVPLPTRDTVWESDKNIVKHHTQESQEVSPFPAGDHKATRNRKDNMAKTNTKISSVTQVWHIPLQCIH